MDNATMVKYIALLRGINVGGNKKVEMAKLKAAFEKAGFKNVKTILNTGNILFETGKSTTATLKAEIITILEKTFGFEIGTIVLPISKIEKIAKENPFKHVKMHDKLRLYVTFTSTKPKTAIKLPYFSPDKSFTIFKKSPLCLFSILDVSVAKTPEVMNVIEKSYGKTVTTRNWNTILKFLK